MYRYIIAIYQNCNHHTDSQFQFSVIICAYVYVLILQLYKETIYGNICTFYKHFEMFSNTYANFLQFYCQLQNVQLMFHCSTTGCFT